MINAVELQKIAEFLNVSMESLVKVPQVIPETNTVKAFMGKVESQEAKDGLAIADEIANMICFYARECKRNDAAMGGIGLCIKF